MLNSINIDRVYQILLISLAFLMPITVSGANVLIVIICFLWLLSGNYKYKYLQILESKLLIASIIFFMLHVVGLAWTEDFKWGLHIIHKMWYFILLWPVLHSIVKKENISLYIYSFLLAISLTEVISYLIWFELIVPFKHATVLNPTPFMSHISYNPILTIAIYLVAHELLFNTKLGQLKFFLYGFFCLTMTLNMFITGGRAGQVMYFVMLSILIFQFFDRQKVKSLISIFILVPAIFISAYQTSYIFKSRVDKAIVNTMTYETNKNTSVGHRFTFAIHSWEIIKKNPIFGVGTGDFPKEYKKINEIKTPEVPNTTNPHNMYTLILVQFGLLGLISLFSILYYQVKISPNSTSRLIRDVGITLPILFSVIMLSDSYLLGHFTTLVFVFFSSFLYKDFEKS